MSDVASAVEQAAEIAKSVPEELRVSAFERAFDALIAESKSTKKAAGKRSKRASSSASRVSKSKSAKNSGKKPGAKALLATLVEEGYLKEARTLPDLVAHLKHSKARTFKQSDLSGPLAAMTRDGILTRQKDADGKYEYRAI